MIDAAIAIDRPVLAIDLPGHGETIIKNLQNRTVDSETNYDFLMIEDAVRAVLNNLGINEFEIAGHSFGALIATSIAANNEFRVLKLHLIEPPLSNERIADDIASQYSVFNIPWVGPIWGNWAVNTGAALFGKTILRKMILENTKNWNLPSDSRIIEAKVEAADKVFEDFYGSMFDLVDRNRIYGQLRPEMPVRVYRAEKSEIFSEKMEKDLVRQWRSDGLKIDSFLIPGINHQHAVESRALIDQILR
jgi:pimeloyl-ACP methyl ester carboxylesterase